MNLEYSILYNNCKAKEITPGELPESFRQLVNELENWGKGWETVAKLENKRAVRDGLDKVINAEEALDELWNAKLVFNKSKPKDKPQNISACHSRYKRESI